MRILKTINVNQNLNTSSDFVVTMNNLPSGSTHLIVKSIVLSGTFTTTNVNMYGIWCNVIEDNILGVIGAYDKTSVSNPESIHKLTGMLTNQIQIKFTENDLTSVVTTVSNRKLGLTLQLVQMD